MLEEGNPSAFSLPLQFSVTMEIMLLQVSNIPPSQNSTADQSGNLQQWGGEKINHPSDESAVLTIETYNRIYTFVFK